MGRGLHQINPHVDSNIQQLKTGSASVASVSLNQSEAFDIFWPTIDWCREKRRLDLYWIYWIPMHLTSGVRLHPSMSQWFFSHRCWWYCFLGENVAIPKRFPTRIPVLLKCVWIIMSSILKKRRHYITMFPWSILMFDVFFDDNPASTCWRVSSSV